MSVHYKFKSALDFDTITFDGLHISVGDLKKAITQQKRLGKSTDFDLQITNAQTREEYADDSTLIPKNTSLIIARIPSTIHHKKIWDPQTEKNQGTRVVNEPNSGILDLSQMNGTEEDKIQAMMIQSTIDYHPNNYQKVRSQDQTGEVPANYRCFKCHKPGHWIRNCTAVSSVEQIEMKRNTGIPRSFIGRNVQDKTFENASTPTGLDKKQEIPEDLICSICKNLLTNAIMIPCCGISFCDECVRTVLLESEENEWGDCKEKGNSPGFLIPNRFLRNSVNAFKNETGYNKQRSQRDPPQKTQTDETNQKQDDGAQENTEDKNLDEDTTESVTEQDAEMETDFSTEESDYEDNITVTVPPACLQAAVFEKNDDVRHL